MRQTILFKFVLLVMVPHLAGQTVKPRTVRDYFMAMPERFFSLDCCVNKNYRKGKEEYLNRYLNVEDTANGYMSGYGDAAQEGFEMALFKRPNGTYLIGFYTYGEGGVEDTPWTVFLDYNNGRWTDVSRRVIPNYSKEKFVYDIPQHGTTLQVFEKDENGEDWYKGKKLYDLIWKAGKFVKK